MTKLNYTQIANFDDKNLEINVDKKNIIENLSGYLNNDHIIYIVNPGFILNSLKGVRSLEEGSEIDFNNVIYKNLIHLYNQRRYYTNKNVSQAFGDIYKNLYEFLSTINIDENNNQSRYLLVVEEDKDDNHLIRGVVKGSLQDGISVCINPEQSARILYIKNNINEAKNYEQKDALFSISNFEKTQSIKSDDDEWV